MPIPSLLVIRSPDIERAVVFYQALGLPLVRHAHGKGPEHYAAEVAGFVFELYPQSDRYPPTTGTRLGFRVVGVDEAVARLTAIGAEVIARPTDGPWGRRAVVADLDGHRVELVEAGRVG